MESEKLMTAPARSNDSEPVLDLARALARMGNDQDLLRDLAGFYIEDAPALLRELEEGVVAEDFEVITRTSHSLKGLSANFDGERAMAAARSIETSGREQDLASIQQQLSELRVEIQNVIDALQRELLN